jgi:hypothetical protein
MSEIEILVETAESFEDYEEAWLACMSHVHWIEDRGPFDYHGCLPLSGAAVLLMHS